MATDAGRLVVGVAGDPGGVLVGLGRDLVGCLMGAAQDGGGLGAEGSNEGGFVEVGGRRRHRRSRAKPHLETVDLPVQDPLPIRQLTELVGHLGEEGPHLLDVEAAPRRTERVMLDLFGGQGFLATRLRHDPRLRPGSTHRTDGHTPADNYLRRRRSCMLRNCSMTRRLRRARWTAGW